MPRSSSGMPIALTKRRPPLLMRIGGGDLLRDVETIGGEVDVVGDERHARADHRGAARSDAARPARSRAPTPAAPSSRPGLRTRRGGCLRGSCAPGCVDASSYRYTGSAKRDATSAATDFASCTHVGHRHAFDRDEGHDVHGAQPRMLALVRCAGRWRPARPRTARECRPPAPSASPASVKTERLCAASDCTSSTRKPGTACSASARRWMTSGRRPSLTLGTHSMTAMTSSLLHLMHRHCTCAPGAPRAAA